MASILLLTAAALQGVQAWGALGHATIAYIAQNYVTDEVATWAQGVLGDTTDSYLANIASWADDYRYEMAGAWSAPLHFIDAEDDPPTSCNVDLARDCSASGCSVSAIANYTHRAGDGRLSAANVQQALKFLVHFIGDITQPLHDEAYEAGANGVKVTYQGYSDNLHADWDTYIPETLVGGSALADARRWAADLVAEIDAGRFRALAAGWVAGDDPGAAQAAALAWARDANALVCTTVMPAGAAALTAASDLYPAYYDAVAPTVELQIAKGGFRLGNWLNLIYAGQVGAAGRCRREAPAAGAAAAAETLPAWRPLSRAQKARAEAGYKCSHSRRDGDVHHH